MCSGACLSGTSQSFSVKQIFWIWLVKNYPYRFLFIRTLVNDCTQVLQKLFVSLQEKIKPTKTTKTSKPQQQQKPTQKINKKVLSRSVSEAQSRCCAVEVNTRTLCSSLWDVPLEPSELKSLALSWNPWVSGCGIHVSAGHHNISGTPTLNSRAG